MLFWGLGAIVGGPVFGIAGLAWRTGLPGNERFAIGLVAAVAIAEGIYHASMLATRPTEGAGFIVAGLLAPLVLGRSREDRLWGYVATLPALALGALGLCRVPWPVRVITGVWVRSRPSHREARQRAPSDCEVPVLT